MPKLICRKCGKEVKDSNEYRHIPVLDVNGNDVICNDCIQTELEDFYSGNLGRVTCEDCGKKLTSNADTILLEQGNAKQKNRYICRICMERRKMMIKCEDCDTWHLPGAPCECDLDPNSEPELKELLSFSDYIVVTEKLGGREPTMHEIPPMWSIWGDMYKDYCMNLDLDYEDLDDAF